MGLLGEASPGPDPRHLKHLEEFRGPGPRRQRERVPSFLDSGLNSRTGDPVAGRIGLVGPGHLKQAQGCASGISASGIREMRGCPLHNAISPDHSPRITWQAKAPAPRPRTGLLDHVDVLARAHFLEDFGPYGGADLA